MSAEIHIGDFNTTFRFTFLDENNAVVNISNLTSREVIFKKPNGERLSKTPSLTTDGTDGLAQYTTASGDIDIKGTWRVQGRVGTASSNWYSDVHSFQVFDNI
jgi:hypothetical protein